MSGDAELKDLFGDDRTVMKEIGPACIRAVGGPVAVADVLARIIKSPTTSDHMILKALQQLGYFVKASAELAKDGTEDEDNEISDEEIEREIERRTRNAAASAARDGDQGSDRFRESETNP